MAEGGGLLNRYRINSPIVGSNPIPSASAPIGLISPAISAIYRARPQSFPPHAPPHHFPLTFLSVHLAAVAAETTNAAAAVSAKGGGGAWR